MTDAERDRMLGEILRELGKIGSSIKSMERRLNATETRLDTRIADFERALEVASVRHSERVKHQSNHDIEQDDQLRLAAEALTRAHTLIDVQQKQIEQWIERTEEHSRKLSALTPQQERSIGLGKGGGAAGLIALAVTAILELVRQMGAK